MCIFDDPFDWIEIDPNYFANPVDEREDNLPEDYLDWDEWEPLPQ